MRTLVWRNVFCNRCGTGYRESDAFTIRDREHRPLCLRCLETQAEKPANVGVLGSTGNTEEEKDG